ncbi:nucleotidyltransferase domain-containing protein [archaeon]|jgi:predicted nucleotidyltransferase|nr:nucleotidyltransferase domain-containing protein [archaeon]MBT6762129.1 nucleotidyltransferase domain-containing protein [archaeon]
MGQFSQKKLKRIVSHLKKHYDAKAIILAGSRVVGDFHKDSDWDLFVWTPKLKKGEDRIKVIERCGFHELKNETKLDCAWIPMSTKKFDWSVFSLKLRYSLVLLDTTEKMATKIRNQAFKIYQKGPIAWSEKKFQQERQRSLGYIKKFQHLLKTEKNGHLLQYLSYYYTEQIIPVWFQLRGEWQLRPQEAFGYIQEQDPKFYKVLQKLWSTSSLNDKVAICKKIDKLLFER